MDRKYKMNEGDWVCSDASCGNLNFARRTSCNRCNREREDSPQQKKKLCTEIGKAAAEKSKGLFSADDWQCNKCGNVNWARRSTCNMCNAPKFGEIEERTGYGGGYNERGVVEYIKREESEDEYDEFGRKKKKKESYGHKKAESGKKSKAKDDEEEEDEDEEEDDDGDLSKYDLSDWGTPGASTSETQGKKGTEKETSVKDLNKTKPTKRDSRSSSSSPSRSSHSRSSSSSRSRSSSDDSRSKSRSDSRSQKRSRNRSSERSRRRSRDRSRSRSRSRTGNHSRDHSSKKSYNSRSRSSHSSSGSHSPSSRSKLSSSSRK